MAEPSPADELWSDLPRRPVTAVAPADDLWSDTPVPPRPAAEEPWADGPSPRAATSPADRPGEPRPSRAATAPDDRWADSAQPRAGTAPPEPPAREPTLVLTDDPPVPPPVPRAPLAAARMPRSVTIPPPPAPPPPPVAPAPAVRAPAVDDDEFADDFDDGAELGSAEGFHGDGFERDEPVTDGGAPGTPRPAEPPPAGGEFARELRRKMSAMAERLFRGEVPPVPVASGPGHDHHTEIDLGGLDEETPLPAAALTDDLGGATYVGELPAPDPAPDARATDGRGTAEVGELRRGTADVPALVARMFAQSFTGRVVFRRGPVEKAVHFDGGRPVFATSNQAHDRMGELLHREGKITREQHDRCRELVRDTGRRMGEILVERGYLKRRELLPAVRRHIEDIIYSLFAWDAGEYRVVAGDGASGERIRLSRHAAALVLEGVRRKLDHDLLEHLLGPPGTVVTIVDRDKLAAVTAVADLSREERAALAALDGLADLDQVARASGAGLEAVYQLAWSLSLLGLVAPRRRVDDDAEAGALIGESDLRIDRERVRARCELCGDADYFSLLGVRRDATGFEIRRAYEAARRDFAPESFPPELRRELAADLDDIAVVLDEAYRVLREDPLRSAYRGHLQDLDPT